jgi:hypothetical protein
VTNFWRMLLHVVCTALAVLGLAQNARAFNDYDPHARNLRISELVTTEAVHDLSKLKIESIEYYPGADADLFNDPDTFPSLKNVWFRYSEFDHMGRAWRRQTNATINDLPPIIGTLARNYPDVGMLGIVSSAPIPTEVLSAIKCFKHLSGLAIEGSTTSDQPLGSFIPRGISSLLLQGTAATKSDSQFPKFESLKSLSLHDCDVSKDFLKGIDSSSLVLLEFYDVRLSSESCDVVDDYKHLRKIILTRTAVTQAVLERWSKRIRIEITIDDWRSQIMQPKRRSFF